MGLFGKLRRPGGGPLGCVGRAFASRVRGGDGEAGPTLRRARDVEPQAVSVDAHADVVTGDEAEVVGGSSVSVHAPVVPARTEPPDRELALQPGRSCLRFDEADRSEPPSSASRPSHMWTRCPSMRTTARSAGPAGGPSHVTADAPTHRDRPPSASSSDHIAGSASNEFGHHQSISPSARTSAVPAPWPRMRCDPSGGRCDGAAGPVTSRSGSARTAPNAPCPPVDPGPAPAGGGRSSRTRRRCRHRLPR